MQLLGSGTILREVLAGADLLSEHFGIEADVWSVTSFTELRRDGMEADAANRLHPTASAGSPTSSSRSASEPGPSSPRRTTSARTPTASAPGSNAPYAVLGTDGFGRSDYRKALRRFFEVDRHHVALAALTALGRDKDARAAIKRYEIDADAEAPWRT